ncbi:MAG: protein translocase subunit SecDF [Flavobacteriales bacterium]|nr:protein translocase subunit SecDF [Flavobacteriales bacterium]MBK9540638.1 protein translocase subunit SecDF [Flavobacteriales bacterium]
MQNRGALWIFTILLALACLWQLSFSLFTSRVESKARQDAGFSADSVLAVVGNAGLDRDSVLLVQENRMLRDRGRDKIYPLFGYTYNECKEKEINLGLDLKGGMAVTLEVSIPELVANLSENSDDATFATVMSSARERQRSSTEDFITLFAQEWQTKAPNAKMAAVFHSADKKDMFPREASNEEIVEALRREARTAINNTENILRNRIDKFGVAQPSIQKQQFSGRIQIELPGVKDKERVRKVLQSTANLEFWETYDNADVYPLLEEANKRLRSNAASVGSAADSLLAAADSTALAADSTALPLDTTDLAADSATADSATGEDLLESLVADSDSTALDTAAGRENFIKENPLFAVLTPSVFGGEGQGYRLAKGPSVGNARATDTAAVNQVLRGTRVADVFPADMRFLWSSKPIEGTDVLTLFAIKEPRGGEPKLDGSSIVNAAQDFDMKGDVEVIMQMDAEGAQTWKVMTGDNVGKCIAIVLDELVYSAPTVISEIGGGRSSISMGSGDLNQQIQEADDLANILKAGALPAPARIIDETIVGPSLGEENISSGLVSFGVALLCVLLVMVLYYARAGWIADMALLANVFFLVGTMASMQATLTLAGIAGIVLTIGMAVDANVLINERVRDEMKQGRMLKSALETAYSNQGALSAIIDSNVTTFVTAIILYLFGSGPIRGFATTLGLGILTSLFTALFISRLLMMWRLDRGKTISFWQTWNKNLFDGVKVDFMGKRRMFYLISLVVIGIGIGSMVTRGFNWGVDFSGGRAYVVEFNDEVDVESARKVMEPKFQDENGRQYSLAMKTYGSNRQLKITTNYLVDDLTVGADERVDAAFKGGLDLLNNPYTIIESRKVDATISDDIKTKALTSVGIALLFMFIYIAIRFSNWQYGAGALLSLVHDVLIVLSLYSLLWGVVGFSMEIDEAFIAVILTVVGYSINDTVVVFDRIREFTQDHKREAVVPLFNKAINSTLSRTLNTGVCTLIVLLIIFFFGGVSIKGFVFGLFVGTLVGTYSSIFVASAAAVDLLLRKKKKGEAVPVAA